MDFLAKVHASHRRHQDVQARGLRTFRQADFETAVAAIHDAHALAVEEYETEIMHLADLERPGRAGGEGRSIEEILLKNL
jgi:hypothetical protein